MHARAHRFLGIQIYRMKVSMNLLIVDSSELGARSLRPHFFSTTFVA
jgi:hypothetical protein